ncbi:ATP-binding cassette domain-containing protein [Phascolarctobacterium faecium]|uniref:ATP-binding cassette domain-containing protein n=1 Tax=Phascolarctobacterium faecium TaxID=33025 RepID=UPI003521471A
MNKQQPLLQINNLSLAYGAKEILKAVQLTVCPGEILGIVGSSGGGKSTLLKTLTGLLPANAVITDGEILWQGRSLLSGGRLNSSGLLGRKLSMIFSGPYSIFISPADDRLANLHYAAGTGAVRYGRQPAVCRAGACRARFF